MKNEWIEDWRKKEELKIPGCTSTSKNLDVALGFSQCKKDYPADKQPVLFIFAINNNVGFSGFRLNSKRYSVYPEEQEFLLMEGFGVFILGIEDKMKISNKFLPDYDGKIVTVIYLLDSNSYNVSKPILICV